MASETYRKNFSIYHMLNKGYLIPEKWIDEEENQYKKEYYRKHNRQVRELEQQKDK